MAVARAIYFIRHGETDWNKERRLQGARDVPLNDVGRAQAETCGRLLQDLVSDPAALDYVASPLCRARETMERARAALGLPTSGYRIDARLTEVAFGAWEARTLKEVREELPAEYAAREADKWHYIPQGGESYELLTKRVAPVVAELAGDTVVVSHGGVARALITLVCGATPGDAPAFPVWQGRILILRGGSFAWIPASVAAAAPPVG